MASTRINRRYLRSHPLLAVFPPLTLRRLLAQATLEEFPKGTTIYRAGERCEAFWLVLSGRCEARTAEGVIERMPGPGDAIGARELLGNEPYRSTLTVLTHSTLLRFPAQELERLFVTRPRIAGRFAAALAGRQPSHSGWLGYSGWRQLSAAPPRRRSNGHSRVVTLASLSTEPAHHPICHTLSLAHAVRQVVPEESLLLIRVVAPGTSGAHARWPDLLERCDQFNGECCLEAQIREEEEIPVVLLSASGSRREADAVAPLLSHLANAFDHVLIHLAVDLPGRAAVEWMVQSDLAYLFVRQTSRELYEYGLLLRTLDPSQSHHLRPVVYLDPSLDASLTAEIFQRLGRPVHAFVRDAPQNGDGEPYSPAFTLHLNRLAREIARCRVGLALSSGGAKGLAHIGVIQVLEEHGVEVDLIAGASMGAYVGAIWAHGYTGEAMERIARELEGRFGLFRLIDPVLPPRQGFIRSTRIGRRLRRSVGEVDFAGLLRPLRVVATHLETMERVVFSSGDLVPAVEASIAIPGVCVPVTIDGETYIDGGICDPLPVDLLIEAGIEKIIAVNTIPTPEGLRRAVELGREVPRRRNVLDHLNRHLNYFARGNILDTLFRSTHGVQMRLAQNASREADLVLSPVSLDARWHDFTHPGRYIALGRQIAEAQWPRIEALLHEKRITPPIPKRRYTAV